MSALGQKQTYALQQAMSAFTPNSDREKRIPAEGHVCFAPESQTCAVHAGMPAVPRDYSMHILIYRIRLESQIAMESTHNG
jgi:hypothetical protein